MTTVARGSKYQKNEAGEFVCPHCGETKSRQNTMFYHLKKHTGEMNYVCTVSGCDRRFVQKSGLIQHMAQAHPEGKPEWGCPCCPHTARMKANMTIHIARMHGDVPPAASSGVTTCIACDRSFASATAYYYHAAMCFSVTEEPVCLAPAAASEVKEVEVETKADE
jgi:hypothetical protein